MYPGDSDGRIPWLGFAGPGDMPLVVFDKLTELAASTCDAVKMAEATMAVSTKSSWTSCLCFIRVPLLQDDGLGVPNNFRVSPFMSHAISSNG
jgi:hypothetical protein